MEWDNLINIDPFAEGKAQFLRKEIDDILNERLLPELRQEVYSQLKAQFAQNQGIWKKVQNVLKEFNESPRHYHGLITFLKARPKTRIRLLDEEVTGDGFLSFYRQKAQSVQRKRRSEIEDFPFGDILRLSKSRKTRIVSSKITSAVSKFGIAKILKLFLPINSA